MGCQLSELLPKLLSSISPKSLIYSFQECVKGWLDNSIHVVVAGSLPWGRSLKCVEHLGGIDIGPIEVVSFSWLGAEDRMVGSPIGQVGVSGHSREGQTKIAHKH